MRDLNKVMLIGNLTRDPEIKTIPSGQNVASFAIATNRSWNDANGELQTAVEYTDVVAWGKLSEIVGQILKKGRRTYVEGRLQTRNWEGQDGVRRYKTEIIASDIIVLDRPRTPGFESDNSSNQTVNTPIEKSEPTPVATTANVAKETSGEIDIEDIPF